MAARSEGLAGKVSSGNEHVEQISAKVDGDTSEFGKREEGGNKTSMAEESKDQKVSKS